MSCNCVNCGAPLKLSQYTCEYCGTSNPAMLRYMPSLSRTEIYADNKLMATYIDEKEIGELVSQAVITMNEGRRLLGFGQY